MIKLIKLNPAYTIKISKFKYQNQYKLTTHQAAIFVIARGGLLSYEKIVKVINEDCIEKYKTIQNIKTE